MKSTIRISRTQTVDVPVEHPAAWGDAELSAAVTNAMPGLNDRAYWWEGENIAGPVLVLHGVYEEPESEGPMMGSGPEPFELTDAHLVAPTVTVVPTAEAEAMTESD